MIQCREYQPNPSVGLGSLSLFIYRDSRGWNKTEAAETLHQRVSAFESAAFVRCPLANKVPRFAQINLGKLQQTLLNLNLRENLG